MMVNDPTAVATMQIDHPWAVAPATLGGYATHAIHSIVSQPGFNADDTAQKTIESSLLIDRLA
jgi:hypothetical protein